MDAIVTDPPYGLSFMGKGWDHGVPGEAFWVEALRVAKPGTHLVAFGGTRTFHRLTCAIEDAGWEIRDCLSWLYGSGFPKSHDVSKAIDKAAGAEREVERVATRSGNAERLGEGGQGATYGDAHGGFTTLSAPATDAAREWQGWGTALKPAWEPIILARKPLVGTVAANVLEHGTGAVNVDGCRVEGGPDVETFSDGAGSRYSGVLNGGKTSEPEPRRTSASSAGRWPANVLFDEAAAAMLDEQSGVSGPKKAREGLRGGSAWHERPGLGSPGEVGRWPGDEGGGASRFFYTAKARGEDRAGGNKHPTVKPIELMRWLVRMVTPPGGHVLDPFAGSGSTGLAAVLEAKPCTLIEREAEYVEVIKRRLHECAPLFGGTT